MNQPLNALLTKLNWQLNELNLNLHEAQNQSQAVTQKIHEVAEGMNQAGLTSLVINPDLEINRLNFLTQQQERKEALTNTLKNHQELENKLNDKIQRVKTELKMLEKYLAREESCQKAQQQKAHDNAMDEWVIQKKESL